MAFTITGMDDSGQTAIVAANIAQEGVAQVYATRVANLSTGKVDAGSLGNVYHVDLGTAGNKYALFYKYTRIPNTNNATLVLLKICAHYNDFGKYWQVGLNGQRTQTPCS